MYILGSQKQTKFIINFFKNQNMLIPLSSTFSADFRKHPTCSIPLKIWFQIWFPEPHEKPPSSPLVQTPWSTAHFPALFVCANKYKHTSLRVYAFHSQIAFFVYTMKMRNVCFALFISLISLVCLSLISQVLNQRRWRECASLHYFIVAGCGRVSYGSLMINLHRKFLQIVIFVYDPISSPDK